jgi:hypothetical protein
LYFCKVFVWLKKMVSIFLNLLVHLLSPLPPLWPFQRRSQYPPNWEIDSQQIKHIPETQPSITHFKRFSNPSTQLRNWDNIITMLHPLFILHNGGDNPSVIVASFLFFSSTPPQLSQRSDKHATSYIHVLLLTRFCFNLQSFWYFQKQFH